MPSRAILAIIVLLITGLPSQAQTPEQELFKKVASLTRAQQRDPAIQGELRKVVLRAIELYCHHLDDLGPQELFCVGDFDLYPRALVNVDGSPDRNVIYVEGEEAPSHQDFGPYILPTNFWLTYLPLDPNKDTLWHEAQHELLCQAGMAGLLYFQASHHNLIEGIGARGATAFGQLRPFEKELRKAAEETRGKKLNLDEERAYWGTAQAFWRRFASDAALIRRVGSAGTSVERYRDVTGTFYASYNEVREWYKGGRLKLADGTPIKPPAWIFELNGVIPADIDIIADPPTVKGTQWERTVGLSVKGDNQPVRQGMLRIQLVTDDSLCGLRVSAAGVGAISGQPGPGGPSNRLFDVDLSKGQPVTLTFTHLRTDKLQSAEYPLALSYSDPGANRRYVNAEREYVFKPANTGQLTLDIDGGRQVEPGKPLRLTARLGGDQTGLQEIFWYDETRNLGLGSGPSVDFKADDAGSYTINVKARIRREGQIVTGAEVRVPIVVKSATAPPGPTTPATDKPVAHLSANLLMASDFFTIWVDLPAGLAARAVEFIWTGGASTTVPRAELQLDAADVGKPIGVAILDSRGDKLGEAYPTPGSYQTVAAKFAFKAPASWKISPRTEGYILSAPSSLEIDETTSKDGRTARARGSAGSGNITIAWLSGDDMRDLNGGKAGPGEWTTSGDPRSRVLRSKGGMGYKVLIEPTSYLTTDGDSTLQDQLQAKWEPQVQAHRGRFDKEVDDLLASLTLTPEGVVERIPDPPMPEAGAPSVRLEGVRPNYRPGEESTVRAVVENAPPGPLQFVWSGPVVGSGAEVKLIAPSTSAGGSVGVTVRGKSGPLAVTQVDFKVSSTRASLSMEPPGPQFSMGTTVTLTAECDAQGEHVYIFEPASLGFQPEAGSPTRARLQLEREGTFEVWVKVCDRAGTVLAESQPLQLEVVPARLQVKLNPEPARVGDTVTATVQGLEPDARCVWELPIHFQELRASETSLEFRPLEPSAGEVRVKAVGANGELGRGSARLTPLPYQVKAQVSSGELLSGSSVGLSVAIEPAPPGSVEYHWSTETGLSLVGGSRGPEVTVRADRPGSFKVTVEARDEKGAIYGRGELTLELTSGAGKASSTMTEAQQAADRGEFALAATLATRAAALDSAGTAAARARLADHLSDLGWQAALKDDFATARPALAAASSLAPEDTRIGKRRSEVARAESAWPRVQELAAKCHKLIDEHKMISAYPVFSEVVMLGNDLCYERMDQHPMVQAVARHWTEQQAEFNRYLVTAELRVKELWDNPAGYQEILELADGVGSWELIPSTRSEVEGWRAHAKAMREQAAAVWVDVSPPLAHTTVGGQVRLQASVRGGTPPYSYEWKVNGQLTAEVRADSLWTLERAGSYSLQVLVTDSQGRTASGEARVIAASPLRAWVDPASYAATPGVAFKTVAQAEGGVPPYRYEWFVGGERSGVVNQVNEWTLNQSGAYALRVLVTDANGTQAYGECSATLGTPLAPPLTAPLPPTGNRISAGTTSAGTSDPGNCHGDPFTGGSWGNARNGSDWIQRDFGDLYRIDGISIGSAGSDVTTDNSSIVIKVLDEQGRWQVVDTLSNTNINKANLSGGARGNSIPSYQRTFSPPLQAWAIRIELAGHGWFSASDVAIRGESVAPAAPPVRPPVGPTPSSGHTVLAVLENASGDAIHLFTAGESFEPSNRLVPGQTRQLTLRLPADGRVEFIAGRSGQILQRKLWAGDPNDPSRYPRVRWTDQGLVVTTGLR